MNKEKPTLGILDLEYFHYVDDNQDAKLDPFGRIYISQHRKPTNYRVLGCCYAKKINIHIENTIYDETGHPIPDDKKYHILI